MNFHLLSDSQLSADTMTKPPIERVRVSQGRHRAELEVSVIEVQGTIMKPKDSSKVLDTERVRLPTHQKRQTYQPMLWNSTIAKVNPPEKLKPCNQDIRKARVKKYCAHYREKGVGVADKKKLDENRTFRMMFVDEKHKAVYCEVPKSACTSWKTFMANITGKVEPKDQKRLYQLVHDTKYHPKIGIKHLDSYTPAERKYILRTYYKFLVVRNPYTRLLSAYNNKFKGEAVQSSWYHEHVGTYIVNRYRNHGKTVEKVKGDDVSFKELVEMISNPNDHNPHRYDDHFWRVQDSCYPCLVDYDYIAKVETMEHDSEVIIKKLVPTVDLHLPFLNKNDENLHKRDFVHAAYNTLPDALLTNLSAIYAEDMEVFGYEFDSDKNYNCNSAESGQPQCC